MARLKLPNGPTPVESIVHSDTRTNLPTSDGQQFVTSEVEAIRQVVLERDATLDPQLVWKGKHPGDDLLESSDLAVDAPPIYIQEKIDPRVLIENLRRTAPHGEQEPELWAFDDFDGLDELDAIEYYQHQAHWANRMILGDSLQVMASLSDREEMRGKVQMVYIDPPYGIKFGSNWQPSASKRDVKDGKDATIEAEQIKAFRDTWELGIHSYLSYLRDRLIAARDLLTESGSCFVQIGDENVHLVRSLMDEVFGRENFVSQIAYATTSGFAQALALGRAGDYVLWYSRTAEAVKTRTLWRRAENRQGYSWLRMRDGSSRGMTSAERAGAAAIPDGAELYKPDNIVSQGAASQPQPFEYRGKTYTPPSGSHWKARYPEGMATLAIAGRLHIARNSVQYVRYPSDFGLAAFTNNWTDTGTGNFTDDKIYVVQSASKLVERCILLSTDPGDLVLDPTCGSGTTAYVAEQWGRRWITIDTSRVALTLARQRLMAAKYPYYLLADSKAGVQKKMALSGAGAPLAEVTDDIRHGFVYERVQHITLKSIANNPDIREGMSREEIDAAIKRHADFEVLYDKPYEDKSKVRVAGRFTVESLSPHRSLAFAGSVADATESATEAAATTAQDQQSFEQTVLDNLRKSGIQNGRKAERIEFDALEVHAGRYVQAIASRIDAETGEETRVAIAIGPQYGTVSQAYARDAVREAVGIGDIDLLCVLGFAFDAHASDGADLGEGFEQVGRERRFGQVTLLTVRMNVDLLMGESLKKTGSGNLFTVFGEPDIEITRDGDEVVAELLGVDVYDPTTGEVRSRSTGDIALWMIDTDYDGTSFFVRHCYFTGGNDPYKRLKVALKAEIDAEAWAALYSTRSRPFAAPSSGRIAVKVINDYGDEVVKVFEV